MPWPERACSLIAVIALSLQACPCLAEASNPFTASVVAALRSGDAANADNMATQALAVGNLGAEDRARVLLNRGLAREKLGRLAESLADFDAALDLNALEPADKSRALFDRGVANDETGRTDEAIADYTASLAINPNFAPALNNRANAYRRQGKFDEAKRDYNASLSANNPQPEYPQYGLGQIAEAQNDPTAARDWYKQALTSNPAYKLAADRLAAIGDVFMPVLKPPAGVVASSDDIVHLRPPVERTRQKTLTPPHMPEPVLPNVASAAYAPPQDTPDLRPAIVEAMTSPESSVQRAARAMASPRSEGHFQIQLGAWTDEAAAAQGWNHLVEQSGHLLDGLTPEIVMADVPGKGRFYRLRAEPTGTSAADLCSRLHGHGIACIPVK